MERALIRTLQLLLAALVGALVGYALATVDAQLGGWRIGPTVPWDDTDEVGA